MPRLHNLLAPLVMCLSAMSANAEITVFAAASLRGALDEVNTSYSDDITVSYASSATLARQIQNGAPADIYISANPSWMQVLQNESLVQNPPAEPLFSNQLVVIGTKPDADFKLANLPNLLDPARLALGITKAVPAGIYAKEALASLGVWQDAAPFTVQTDNVRAALRLVALGEVDYAIVYQTDALQEPRVHVLAHIPQSAHAPILYPAGQIADTDQAAQYLAFLHSPKAQDIFAEYGFVPISKPAKGGS